MSVVSELLYVEGGWRVASVSVISRGTMFDFYQKGWFGINGSIS